MSRETIIQIAREAGLAAVSFNNSQAASDWNHVGTLEPRMWIQAHWKDVW